MLGKSPKDLEMSPTFSEAADLLKEVAGESGSIKVKITRVAVALRCGERRARAFWNGEVRRVDAEEMDRLRLAAKRYREIGREQHVGDELRALRERVAQLESRLAAMAGDGLAAKSQD